MFLHNPTSICSKYLVIARNYISRRGTKNATSFLFFSSIFQSHIFSWRGQDCLLSFTTKLTDVTSRRGTQLLVIAQKLKFDFTVACDYILWLLTRNGFKIDTEVTAAKRMWLTRIWAYLSEPAWHSAKLCHTEDFRSQKPFQLTINSPSITELSLTPT